MADKQWEDKNQSTGKSRLEKEGRFQKKAEKKQIAEAAIDKEQKHKHKVPQSTEV